MRREGDQLRIAVQLIDAVTDSHLWAATYDRQLTDLFAIQSDVARQVTAMLSAAASTELPLPASNMPTPDVNAYDLVLQGRAQVRPAT